MSKKSDREERYAVKAKEQLEKAFEFPFCRKCKEPLAPEWVVKLKRDGTMPLCKVCLPIVMEQYRKGIEAWQKFNRR